MQTRVSGFVNVELRERLSKIFNFGAKPKRKHKKEEIQEEKTVKEEAPKPVPAPVIEE